ncbi:MAG: glycosyltransferase [Alicyclobacillus sp.]|nr:glycosyltransferase [Alicyclobacillus sp.]
MAKIGIYNLYWSTLGGGEKHLGEFASALGDEHEVWLITQDPKFELSSLDVKLGIDVEALRIMRVPNSDETYIEQIGTAFDLFINGTYRSSGVRSRAPRSAYFVFFPQELHPTTVLRGPTYYMTGSVSHYRGNLGQHLFGVAKLVICNAARTGRVLRMIMSPDTSGVTVWYGEQRLDTRCDGAVLEFEVPTGLDRLELTIGVEVSRGRPSRYIHCIQRRNIWGWIEIPAQDVEQIHSSYDRIIVNSSFTGSYVTRLWNRTDWTILHPPVDQFGPRKKVRQVVSVGRFFRGDHSKKQEILIQAFKMLYQRHPEFRLKLLGGLKNIPGDEEYAKSLIEMAKGYPIEFCFNATRDDLAHAYGESMFYWHATGYGENLEVNPDRAEHFGIAPVEAMSAGCIPLVYRSGGVSDYLSPECGYTWTGVKELVDLTESLLINEEKLRMMSARCRERARMFAKEHFAQRARSIVRDVLTPELKHR